MKLAIYPFKFMRITQRHDKGNHLAHWQPFKDHSDKPWDEALQDSGRGWFEPNIDYVVEEKRMSVNDNSVRLKTVDKVLIPYQKEPVHLHLTLTHMENDDMNKIKKGTVIKANTKVLREGNHGNSSGNHLHITANIGKYYGFKKNSNGKWCFVYEKSLMPHEAFYLDTNYTKVLNSQNYPFLAPPVAKITTTVSRDEKVPQFEVLVDKLNVRTQPNLKGSILGYAEKGFYNLTNIFVNDGYEWYEFEKGKFSAFNVNWIKLHKPLPIEPPIKEEPIIIPDPPIKEEPIEEIPIEEPIEEEPIDESPKKTFLEVLLDLIKQIIKNIFKEKK